MLGISLAPLGLYMVVAFVVFILLLLLAFLEAFMHKRNLKSVPLRILVNGTRGKTTIVRLLAAALNESGIRTLGRTTGSDTEIIYPDGRIERVIRKRNARVYELISFFRIANREKVSCVVVECMALQSENQRAIRDKLVCPTDVIISNTYVDHVPEMGNTRESTAEVLAQSIPRNARLYVTEDFYDNIDARINHIDIDFGKNQAYENINPISLAICKAFLEDKNIDVRSLDNAIASFVPDQGLLRPLYTRNNTIFVPDFSVNDLTCMKEDIAKWAKEYGKVSVIFNNRRDREYRIFLIEKAIIANSDVVDSVYAIGDYKKKVARRLSRKIDAKVLAVSINELYDIIGSSSGEVFISLGNIHGSGEELIAMLYKGIDNAI